jgi:hypothetical protein
MKKTWTSLLLLIAAVSSCALPLAKPAQALTALPMTISLDEKAFHLTVPDTDTTHSAYGGRLRLYDVHLAKMFEVTNYLCSAGRVESSTLWSYRAGNGSIDMGNFQISCDLANDVAIAYGLGDAESTEVYFSYGEAGSGTDSLNVPILSITGGKVERWIRFTNQFMPIGD